MSPLRGWVYIAYFERPTWLMNVQHPLPPPLPVNRVIMMHLLATQHLIVDAEQGVGEPHGEALQYFCEERILVFTPHEAAKRCEQ